MSKSQRPPRANRLVSEKSPYLQQHASNPVEWYPWGEEAFAEARRQDKPVFLSIGYSTCHWCHVMAHESFEDSDIAELLNASFVSIKVDREERPDIDALYMTAVQMLTGSGGWPMSIWLTPDKKPFYAGTYFPPRDAYGRPGFPSVLAQLADIWKNDRAKIMQSSERITDALRTALVQRPPADDLPAASAVRQAAIGMLKGKLDPINGGFGSAPKFPMPTYLDLFLLDHERSKNPESLHAVEQAMEHMAAGGIFDQLGGGFARYSTDAQWLVPHFEKMLYDNAQLAMTCVRLYGATKNPNYERIVRHTLDYLLRDLRHTAGGFFSAEDADSEGREGAFYLWTLSEIRTHLPPPLFDAFVYAYGLTAHGNFIDPHSELVGQNVLYVAHSAVEVARYIGESVEKTEILLKEAGTLLFEVRAKRVRPHRDEKILTEWNGLAISAFAAAGRMFGEPRYTEAAERAAEFVRSHLFDTNTQRLYRRWRDGERKITGQQTDYAMLVQGLIDLFEATGRADWLRSAVDLQSIHDRLFEDRNNGGYFMTEPAEDMLVRMKDETDNVIPSGNAVAALNGFRLYKWTGDSGVQTSARRTVRAFVERLREQPTAVTKMVLALDAMENFPKQLIVVGPPGTDEWKQIQLLVRDAPANITPLLLESGPMQEDLGVVLPYIREMRPIDGRPTGFLCVNFACQKPTVGAVELGRALGELQKS